ncbi:hypothetical protein BKA61DRAFT_584963 [Leptodontidium sp. MPI-SDFR-AT-0119]|nr:hypothetical protein BKA61DRAFT_584963 [Leptodontidium sp. MPI-SDFR-AT-0119]
MECLVGGQNQADGTLGIHADINHSRGKKGSRPGTGRSARMPIALALLELLVSHARCKYLASTVSEGQQDMTPGNGTYERERDLVLRGVRNMGCSVDLSTYVHMITLPLFPLLLCTLSQIEFYMLFYHEEWGLFIAPVRAAMNEHTDGLVHASVLLPGANADMQIRRVSDLGSVVHPPRTARNRVGIPSGLVCISDGQLPEQRTKMTASERGVLERLPSWSVCEGGPVRASHGFEIQCLNIVPDRDTGLAEFIKGDSTVRILTAVVAGEREEVFGPVPRPSRPWHPEGASDIEVRT